MEQIPIIGASRDYTCKDCGVSGASVTGPIECWQCESTNVLVGVAAHMPSSAHTNSPLRVMTLNSYGVEASDESFTTGDSRGRDAAEATGA